MKYRLLPLAASVLALLPGMAHAADAQAMPAPPVVNNAALSLRDALAVASPTAPR